MKITDLGSHHNTQSQGKANKHVLLLLGVLLQKKKIRDILIHTQHQLQQFWQREQTVIAGFRTKHNRRSTLDCLNHYK
jgi:hypothetical protein